MTGTNKNISRAVICFFAVLCILVTAVMIPAAEEASSDTPENQILEEMSSGEQTSEAVSEEQSSEKPGKTDPLPTSPYVLLKSDAATIKTAEGEKTYYRKVFVTDADRDGYFDSADARIVLRVSAKLEKTDLPASYLDADGNGQVDAADARMLLRASAKLDRYYISEDGKLPPAGSYRSSDSRFFIFDSTGLTVEGYYEEENLRFLVDSNGKPMQDIRTYKGETCFFMKDGSLYTGFVKQHGVIRFFTKGVTNEGLVSFKRKVYYSLANGTLFKGWKAVDKYTYYFTEDGSAATGMVKIGDYYYCFGEDGRMVFGFQTVGDEMYYFDQTSGHMVTNTQIDGYIIGLDGRCSKKPVKILAPYQSTYGYIVSLVIEYPVDNEDWELVCLNSKFKIEEGVDQKIKLSTVAGSSEQMDSRAAYWYDKMYEAAKKDGILLTPVSGYRSYADQKRLFKEFVDEYRAAGKTGYESEKLASTRRMPEGSSEHNIGICMDIITASSSDNFEKTAAYRWLSANAADYGFILRYPYDKQDVTGVKFEPWHWRYVGVKNARAIKDSGKCLEEYLALP
ncbi:MAG: D-alanyl-D-alanine carboxypeptidase family protein [Clostridia bacterium]|nr:D-alanyl-D-alanine carboxypeptidase family protein [Clostridia bacterium]